MRTEIDDYSVTLVDQASTKDLEWLYLHKLGIISPLPCFPEWKPRPVRRNLTIGVRVVFKLSGLCSRPVCAWNDFAQPLDCTHARTHPSLSSLLTFSLFSDNLYELNLTTKIPSQLLLFSSDNYDSHTNTLGRCKHMYTHTKTFYGFEKST